MIGVYAHAFVKEEYVDNFCQLALELLRHSRQEAGAISYDFGPLLAEDAGQGQQRDFAFVERWESYAALQAHMETEHYQWADQHCQQFLAAPMQISIYDLLESPAGEQA